VEEASKGAYVKLTEKELRKELNSSSSDVWKKMGRQKKKKMKRLLKKNLGV